MRTLARKLLFALAILTIATGQAPKAESARIPPVLDQAEFFTRALAAERPAQPRRLPVTGIAVPHHLLAPDLIARGVLAAAGNAYDRIIVISPDHFRRSHRAMATTRRGFDTPLGPVDVDKVAAEILIGRPDLVDDSDLFVHEHGITGLMPFLHAVFPGTPVVPVALGIRTDRQEWDAVVDLLKQIVTPQTLIVQSTDYSHYLSPEIAQARDQETLNVIAARDPAAVVGLQQANHLDSKAAQYVQMRLQHDVFHSYAAVVANRNSIEYTHQHIASTSYIVTVYATDGTALSTLAYPDQQIVDFGGDVFLGRRLTAPLLSKDGRDIIIDGVRRLTGGQPLVVNLEGVITPDPPIGVPAERHVMDDGLAGPVLQAINVFAAGLANNHSFDLGAQGLATSVTTLERRRIHPLRHMKIENMGAFRLVALNFVGARDFKAYPVVRVNESDPGLLANGALGHLCHTAARPPLVALVHWGKEYSTVAGDGERVIAEALAACGVSFIIGSHSHQASSNLEPVVGGEALMYYSLGNLLFDQRSPNGSGSVIELRVFKQGTFAARIIPAPNLYDAVSVGTDYSADK